jgi:hypothetical protein
METIGAIVERGVWPRDDTPRYDVCARFYAELATGRGDYRVIYRIDPERHRVEIVAIERRSDAYRSR